VHKAYSDAVVEAVSGAREDIPAVLKRHVETVHDAAVGN
jgi:hypothetical protein